MNDAFCQFFSSGKLLGKGHMKKHGLGYINRAVFSLHCKRFLKQHLEILRAALFYS